MANKKIRDDGEIAVFDDMDPPAREDALPLFFKDPHPLDIKRHRHAGLNKSEDASYARDVNSLPIHQYEFAEAARSYPIVVAPGKTPVALAMVGLAKHNNFVDRQGRWRQGAYVPAYVRKYPFTLMQLSNLDKFALCVDEAAQGYAAENPQMPFYDASGEATEMTRQALEFCGQYQKCHSMTAEFIDALERENLLEAKEVQAQMPDGRQARIGGFMVLSEERWRALPDETFLNWRNSHWIDFAQIMLMSQVNWKYLTAE